MLELFFFRKENNWNMLSKKFQFSCRYLQVVPDCWHGQQVGNPSHEQLLKKSDLNLNIRHCVRGRGGSPHAGFVLLLLCFVEKSDFCNCAIFKPSWCIKNILYKAEVKTILLTLSAWCLSSAVCLPSAPSVGCLLQTDGVRSLFSAVWGNKRVMV